MEGEPHDPVLRDILRFNEGRKPLGVRLKIRLMAAGGFSFFRATNHLFAAEWASLRPLDPGPMALICGDLHLENFGAYLTDDGECKFSINDFDEAYVAPVGIDLVRCSASILLAAEEWSMSTTRAAALVVEFLDCYREEVASVATAGSVDGVDPSSGEGEVLDLLGPTSVGSREALLARQTVDVHKLGRHSLRVDGEHRPVGKKKLDSIRSAFREMAEASEVHRSIEVIDATTRVAGLGSLGLRRYLVLTRRDADRGHPRLLDVKEAAPSALQSCVDCPQPAWGQGEAARVITAERLVLGKPESGLAEVIIGPRSYRVRDMIPDANRSKLSRLRRAPMQLRSAVRAAGGIAAWSHARGVHALDPLRVVSLAQWSGGAAFDSIMVAAARAADRCRDDYDSFRRSLARRSVRRRLGLSPGNGRRRGTPIRG